MRSSIYPILFLCFISILSVFSQEKDSTLVRLKSVLDIAIEDSAKVKTMLELGEYQLKRDFSLAEDYFNQGLELIKNRKEDEYKDYRAALYIQLGVVHRRKAYYPTAIEYYVKALKHYELTGDTSKIADVYHNMALVYRYQKEHRRAIENYKKTIVLKESVKDTFGLGAGYNMLGVSYRQNKQLDSALICYQKAHEYFSAIDSEEDLHGVNGNLAVLYAMQKKYHLSLPLKKANLRYYKKLGKQLSICVEYHNIYSDYRKMKNWETALSYIDSSLQVAAKEGFRERVLKAYQKKSYVYAQLGNYRDAHESYRIYKKYNDTVFNITNAKKMQALELNYKFQKEKQADSLQFVLDRREVELIAQTESSKKKLYFALLLVTLLGAVVIGYLIRRNYQQRSKLAKATYENEKKILDLEIKEKEEDIKRLIADNSMRLAFKEELLDKLKTDIAGSDPQNIKQSLNSLTTQLRLQIETESKLSGLQEKIDAVNKKFDTNLQKQFPELTKGEREVCALLRLNLSIKEIMTIRNVSSDSVKSMRRRIRKKMNVPQDIELESFIQALT